MGIQNNVNLLLTFPAASSLNMQFVYSFIGAKEFGSISVTLMPARFRYLAQVAPPKPPPTTTTCATHVAVLGGVGVETPSMPSADAAPAPPVSFRKSLRVMRPAFGPPLEAADVFGDRRDLGVRVALGLGDPSPSRARAGLEVLYRLHREHSVLWPLETGIEPGSRAVRPWHVKQLLPMLAAAAVVIGCRLRGLGLGGGLAGRQGDGPQQNQYWCGWLLLLSVSSCASPRLQINIEGRKIRELPGALAERPCFRHESTFTLAHMLTLRCYFDESESTLYIPKHRQQLRISLQPVIFKKRIL